VRVRGPERAPGLVAISFTKLVILYGLQSCGSAVRLMPRRIAHERQGHNETTGKKAARAPSG
jgi:hypothetical protein